MHSTDLDKEATQSGIPYGARYGIHCLGTRRSTTPECRDLDHVTSHRIALRRLDKPRKFIPIGLTEQDWQQDSMLGFLYYYAVLRTNG